MKTLLKGRGPWRYLRPAMKYVLTAALIVVASGLPVTAADKTVRLYPTPLPASQMLIDLSGKLVKAEACQKKVAQCV
jgi:hypothetical protein